MKCPHCGKKIEHVIATQIVHINVKVNEFGDFIENANDACGLYENAYEFEDPIGDYACPECGEYCQYLEEFAD